MSQNVGAVHRNQSFDEIMPIQRDDGPSIDLLVPPAISNAVSLGSATPSDLSRHSTEIMTSASEMPELTIRQPTLDLGPLSRATSQPSLPDPMRLHTNTQYDLSSPNSSDATSPVPPDPTVLASRAEKHPVEVRKGSSPSIHLGVPPTFSTPRMDQSKHGAEKHPVEVRKGSSPSIHLGVPPTFSTPRMDQSKHGQIKTVSAREMELWTDDTRTLDSPTEGRHALRHLNLSSKSLLGETVMSIGEESERDGSRKHDSPPRLTKKSSIRTDDGKRIKQEDKRVSWRDTIDTPTSGSTHITPSHRDQKLKKVSPTAYRNLADISTESRRSLGSLSETTSATLPLTLPPPHVNLDEDPIDMQAQSDGDSIISDAEMDIRLEDSLSSSVKRANFAHQLMSYKMEVNDDRNDTAMDHTSSKTSVASKGGLSETNSGKKSETEGSRANTGNLTSEVAERWLASTRSGALRKKRAKEIKSTDGSLSNLRTTSAHFMHGLTTIGRHGVIHPESLFRTIWDLSQIVILMYVSFSVPYRVAFQIKARFGWFIFEVFVDSLFIVDIVLNFFTAYIDRERVQLVYDRKLIAKNYLTSWFALDFVSCIPLQYILDAVNGDLYCNFDPDPDCGTGGGSGAALRFFKVLRLIRLFKILRLLKLGPIMEKMQHRFIVVTRYLPLLHKLFMLYFLGHLSTCVFYWVSDNLVLTEAEKKRFNAGELVPWVWEEFGKEPLSPDRYEERYITCLYWSITTLTTVGYGDIVGNTTAERLCALSIQIIGCFYFGFIIASIANMITSISASKNSATSCMHNVLTFTLQQGFPGNLRRRIIGHYLKASKYSTAMNLHKVIDDVPKAVREDLLVHIHHKNIKDHALFKGCSDEFTIQICKRMKHEEYMKNSLIFQEGEIGTEIYYISAGECEEYDEMDGRQVELYSSGHFIGAEALFLSAGFYPRECAVRASKPSTICIIDGTVLSDLVAENGEYREELRKMFNNCVDMYPDYQMDDPDMDFSEVFEGKFSAGPNLSGSHLGDISSTMKLRRRSTFRKAFSISKIPDDDFDNGYPDPTGRIRSPLLGPSDAREGQKAKEKNLYHRKLSRAERSLFPDRSYSVAARGTSLTSNLDPIYSDNDAVAHAIEALNVQVSLEFKELRREIRELRARVDRVAY